MFSFANPYLLYLLFLIPAITGLYLLSRYSRKRKLKRYGKLAVLSPLMPDASRYKPWIKITLQLLAVAALVFVLARPRAGAKEEVSEVQGIEVMICLDVSNSMLASSTDDPKGVSRLQRAKLVLEKLIDKLDNDKVGLIVFAGDAYTLYRDGAYSGNFDRSGHRDGYEFIHTYRRHAESHNRNNRRRKF